MLLTQQQANVNRRRPTAPAIAIRIIANVDRSPESYPVLYLEALSPAKSTWIT